MKKILLILFVTLQVACSGQNVLKQIVSRDDTFHTKYEAVLKHPKKYHLQVIYTQINRDKNNVPHLKRYYLYPKSKDYFYPASLVKLPFSALALEKIDSLHIDSLTRNTRLMIDSAHECQTREFCDTTSKTCYPSVAQYIRRMLLVSDNHACNRIYEFLSPAYINQRLHEMGYKNIMINQRLSWSCDSTDNRYTNPFVFLSSDSSVIYKQPADSNRGKITNDAQNTVIGKGFKDHWKILPPKDFRYNNYIPFRDENNILISLIFPKSVPAHQRFHLTQDDYRFLHKYMSMLPRESIYPTYNRKIFKDNFKKYIYFGTMDTIPDSNTVRSFNIVGRAYGFLSDCAYITDTASHSEFFLSVLMFVNKKEILNTGDYQYDTIALPFMSDLGHIILNYEKKRKKKHVPNLSEFELKYP